MKFGFVIIAIFSVVSLMAQDVESVREASDSPMVQSSEGLRRVKDSGKGKGGSKDAAMEGGKGGHDGGKGGSKSSKGGSKSSKGGSKSSKGSSKGKGGNPKHKKRVRSKRTSKDSPPEELVVDSVTCAPSKAAKTSEPTHSPVDIPDEPLVTPAPTVMQMTDYPTAAPIPATDEPSVKEATEDPTPAPIPATDAPFLRTVSPTKAPIPVTDAPTDKAITEAPTQAPVNIPEEPLVNEEESNDDTLLEHICGILELVDAGAHKNPAILRSAITESNPVLDFDWYNYCSGPPNHFLCPNEYETGKICDRKNPETAAAVLAAYCKPLFKPFEEGNYTEEYRKQCIEHCVNYVSLDRGACCNFDCSSE